MLTPPQFRRLTRKSDTSSFYHIGVLAEAKSSNSSIPLPPRIQALVDYFGYLFQPPSSLPLERVTDHHIHLILQVASMSVRPYLYPHYQK